MKQIFIKENHSVRSSSYTFNIQLIKVISRDKVDAYSKEVICLINEIEEYFQQTLSKIKSIVQVKVLLSIPKTALVS